MGCDSDEKKGAKILVNMFSFSVAPLCRSRSREISTASAREPRYKLFVVVAFPCFSMRLLVTRTQTTEVLP